MSYIIVRSMFEFSSQSSVLLYLGYDTHVSQKISRKVTLKTHSNITKTLTSTLEHRYTPRFLKFVFLEEDERQVVWHKFFSIRDDCNKKEPAREENEEKKIRLDVERNVLVEKQDEHEVIRMIRRVITRLGDETMYEWKYHSHSKPKMKNNNHFRYKQGLDMVALTISKFVIKKHPEDYIVSLIEFFSLSNTTPKTRRYHRNFCSIVCPF